MEVQKRKIYLESSTDRTENSKTWGEMTATTFYLNVFITQDMDDMGLFNDMSYIPKTSTSISPNYSILKDKLFSFNLSFPFMYGIVPNSVQNYNVNEEKTLRIPSKVVNDYYKYGNLQITGATDSKLEDVRTYSTLNPFKIGFNTGTNTYTNYENDIILGVDRVKTLSEPITYVFDTPNDINLGTPTQINGLQYLDYTSSTRNVVIDGVKDTIPLTIVKYKGEGWNETNTSLSGLTKEEYLFGIISRPEVESDVFIDRGTISVMDYHLKMSEIKNLGQLTRYGNGFYKINKQ